MNFYGELSSDSDQEWQTQQPIARPAEMPAVAEPMELDGEEKEVQVVQPPNNPIGETEFQLQARRYQEDREFAREEQEEQEYLEQQEQEAIRFHASLPVQSMEDLVTLVPQNKAEILSVIDAKGGEATLADVLVDKPITHLGRYFMASLMLVQERVVKMTTMEGADEPAVPSQVFLKRIPYIEPVAESDEEYFMPSLFDESEEMASLSDEESASGFQ